MKESNEEMQEIDNAVEEVRRVRHQVSACFDHDVEKLGGHLMEYQKKFADRLVLLPEDEKSERPAA